MRHSPVDHRLAEMAAYFPDALVAGYEGLTGSMANHPKDRHVLAAAVAGRADVLVTAMNESLPASTGAARLGRRQHCA